MIMLLGCRKRRMIMTRRGVLAFLCVVALFAAAGFCRAADMPVYEASNAMELLKAIGPDRIIQLTGTEYRLTECADLPDAKNPYVRWEDAYDGPELTVCDVSNLTIRGAGKTPAHLVIEPRYAYVVHFVNARNVALDNVRAGHTEIGYCLGGVLYFESGGNVRVSRSVLYGCGTEGLRLEGVKGFSCRETTVKECSYYIMTLLDSADVSFAGTVMTDNAEFEGIRIAGCRNVLFDGCLIRRNGSDTILDTGLFHVFTSEAVKVKDSIIEENTADYFLIGDKEMELVGTVVRNNRFTEGEFRKVKYGDMWRIY